VWILIALCWVIGNAIPYFTVYLALRFTVAGMPINMLDVLLPAAMVVGVVNTRINKSYIPTGRAHPLLTVILIAFAVNICVGVGVAMSGTNNRWAVIQQTRDGVMLPMAVLAGYCLVSNFKAASWLLYAMVFLGLYLAIMHLTHFTSTAVTTFTTDPNVLGTVEYGVGPLDMATALLAFCLLVGSVHLLPIWLERTIAVITFTAALSSMHRSSWLASIAAVLATTLAVPAGLRLRGAARLTSTMIVLLVAGAVAFLAINVVAERDLSGMIVDRLGSILPGYVPADPTVHAAWDTRTPGLWADLDIWTTSPIFGRGYGFEVTQIGRYGEVDFGHTPWAQVLAVTGLVGFTAYSLIIWGIFVVGRRMALAARDRTTMLVGVLGLVFGIYNFLYGWMTGIFVGALGAVALGLIAGIVLRCRAMQLEHQRQQEMSTAGAPLSMPWARPVSV
jgi:hypothetical protein